MSLVSRYSMSRPFRVFGTARSSCRCASKCEDKRTPSMAQNRRRDLLMAPLLACTIYAAPGQTTATPVMHTHWPVSNRASVACILRRSVRLV